MSRGAQKQIFELPRLPNWRCDGDRLAAFDEARAELKDDARRAGGRGRGAGVAQAFFEREMAFSAQIEGAEHE